MPLVKTIDANDLLEAFQEANRDYYSFGACEAMVEYFEEFPENTELDIVGLCGDFTEHDSAKDWYIEYNGEDELENAIKENELEDEDEIEDFCMDELENTVSWYRKLDNGAVLVTDY